MGKDSKRTIVEAIKEVMIQADKPMSPKEIYSAIVKSDLYNFKATNPVHVVNSQIRRHCKDLPPQNSYSKTKYFYAVGDRKYFYLENPYFPEESKEKVKPKNEIPADNEPDPLRYAVKPIMDWFLSEFEPLYDRVSNSFEDSEYIDVIDGPYSTLDVIKDKFWGLARPNAISKAVELLEDEFKCFEWSKIPKDRDINNYYLSNLGTNFYKDFKASITYINKLSRPADGPYTLKSELEKPLHRMLYASVITAMESYLSDAFTKVVLSNHEKLKIFVRTTKEFQNQKISLSDIFQRIEKIDQEVSDYLAGISFHNLGKVEALYKNTLDIEFPKEQARRIRKAIAIRHD
jgi:hypothetical protein